MTVPPVDAPLARYARLLHAAAGQTHHIASPVGAWLLLALSSSASRGQDGARRAGALGTDVREAAALAARLLDHPHPAVAAAAGLWVRHDRHTAALDAWAAGLPGAAGTGDIPDQSGLDAWARRHTLDMIDAFPVAVTADTLLVLATALATRVTWREPFATVPVDRLGPASSWAGQVRTLLTAGGHAGHDMFITATDQVGDVAVHAAAATQDLRVYSVIADRHAPAADVLDAALRVATAAATGRPVARRSLFDLPLGEQQLWTISEHTGPVFSPGGTQETLSAVLPAWAASSEHQLARPELGFPLAAGGLAALAAMEEFDYQARQTAAARYNRFGFEAAAVSGMAVTLGAALPQGEGRIRDAELRFAHPYAVVAVAVDGAGAAGRRPGNPWRGLPVFSGWVAEAAEPDEQPQATAG